MRSRRQRLAVEALAFRVADALLGALSVGLGAAALGRNAPALRFDGTAAEAESRIAGENFTNRCAMVLRRRGKQPRRCGSVATRVRFRAAALVKFSSMPVSGYCGVGAHHPDVAALDAEDGDPMPSRCTS